MFEIGFGELLLVFVILLFVVKPKHLPAIARVAARRFLHLKSSIHRFKAEVKAELQDLTPPNPNDP